MNNTSSVEPLGFTLDQANGAPVYRQIIRQIESWVLSGRLKTGDRLPTIRSLAVALKINPNTIAKAYGELEIRGILATQVGSGTYVSDRAPLLGEKRSAEEGLRRKIREALGRFVQDMRDLGVEEGDLAAMLKQYLADKRAPASSGLEKEAQN